MKPGLADVEIRYSSSGAAAVKVARTKHSEQSGVRGCGAVVELSKYSETTTGLMPIS